jgi:Mn-dependent DtxR family transcriptional regulator
MEKVVETKQQTLLTILVSNKAFGEEYAIKGSTLAEMLCTSAREVNNLARDLRREGYRVISSKSCHGGYFITNDIQELEHFYHSHESQAREHKNEMDLTNSLLNQLQKQYHNRGIFYVQR